MQNAECRIMGPAVGIVIDCVDWKLSVGDGVLDVPLTQFNRNPQG